MFRVVSTALLLTMSAAGAARADLESLALEPLATNVPLAAAVTHAGDGRLFVSLLGGQVRIFEDGSFHEQPFLDLTGRVFEGIGLWSIAFDPGFAVNGLVFVHWAEDVTGDSVISRFRVSEDPDRVDPASEATLLRIPKAETLHYGGALHFGPDRCLYVSTGDGTGSDTGADPQCVAQSLDSLEGKILRLDVGDGSEPPYYSIPPGNPFAGIGRDEIWAYGLRNPWRFSFDRETGDLWIADVGSSQREEIDFQPAGSPGGQNYGWKILEGTRCLQNRIGCGPEVPGCGDPGLIPPFIEYQHAPGHCAVIGGIVYRGRLLPDLYGAYVYADHCSGAVWADVDEGGVRVSRLLPFSLPQITAFAGDAAGELLITTLSGLYRLIDLAAPEAGLVELDVTALEVSEEAGTVEIAVHRLGSFSGAVSVEVAASAESAVEGADFVAPDTVLTWADGEGGTRIFALQILDDVEDEAAETLAVELSSPTGGAVLGARRRAQVTIVDDDDCVPGETTMCLRDGRFRVEVAWRDFEDETGVGKVLPFGSDQTGLLWFFDPDNWEMMVKVLDGCDFNDRFWVFSAATTNVEYTLTVTDTSTDDVRTYHNPLGTSAPALTDVEAFATCDAAVVPGPACGGP
ncbi:MAG: PQQ-dependent sugar dehydrogenase [Thermoanaerobaculia bacterium]